MVVVAIVIRRACSKNSVFIVYFYCKAKVKTIRRSEEHTSELQSRPHLVCRLLLEKKKLHMTGGRCVTYGSCLWSCSFTDLSEYSCDVPSKVLSDLLNVLSLSCV